MDSTPNTTTTSKDIIPPTTTQQPPSNPLSPIEPPTNFDPMWDLSDDEGCLIETWSKLVHRVTKTTEKAFLKSPTFDLSTPTGQSAFQAHWWGVFTTLEESIKSDASIPEYLTSPPVKKFDINLFVEEHRGQCPCCLPRVKASIVLENEDGVTKGDFVRALGGYLFRTRSDGRFPMVYSYDKIEGYEGYLVKGNKKETGFSSMEVEVGGEHGLLPGPRERDGEGEGEEEESWDCFSVFEYRFPALPYMADWMSNGTAKGRPLVYKHDRGGPLVWLYCCMGDEFGGKIRKLEEEEEGEEQSGMEDIGAAKV